MPWCATLAMNSSIHKHCHLLWVEAVVFSHMVRQQWHSTAVANRLQMSRRIHTHIGPLSCTQLGCFLGIFSLWAWQFSHGPLCQHYCLGMFKSVWKGGQVCEYDWHGEVEEDKAEASERTRINKRMDTKIVRERKSLGDLKKSFEASPQGLLLSFSEQFLETGVQRGLEGLWRLALDLHVSFFVFSIHFPFIHLPPPGFNPTLWLILSV